MQTEGQQEPVVDLEDLLLVVEMELLLKEQQDFPELMPLVVEEVVEILLLLVVQVVLE
jgi:hypothetical protein